VLVNKIDNINHGPDKISSVSNYNSKKENQKLKSIDNSFANDLITLDSKFKYSPRFELSALTSGPISGTEAKLLLPLYQSQNITHLIYLDLRAELNNATSHQFDVGIGYRKLFPNTNFLYQKQWILGVYGAAGKSYGRYKKHFQQQILGVEALSETYDFRANFYIAKDKKKQVAASSIDKIDYEGYELTDTYFKHQVALTGSDVELGYKLPIFSPEIKLYLGAYFYQKPKNYNSRNLSVYSTILAKNGYNSINGQKGRVEINLNYNNLKLLNKNTSLTLATQYNHDPLNKGQLFAIAKFSYQFGNQTQFPTTKNKYKSDLKYKMNEFTVRNYIVTDESEELIRNRRNASPGRGSGGEDNFIVD
jgi:hypothetical protein